VTHYRSTPRCPGAHRGPGGKHTFLNAPVAFVLGSLSAAAGFSQGEVAGITSVLLVMLMSQPRIFFSMSRDRLLPPGVSKVHPRFGTPYITTIITCVVVALVAGSQIQVVRDDQHRDLVRVRGGAPRCWCCA
jgi:amino acid transporter